MKEQKTKTSLYDKLSRRITSFRQKLLLIAVPLLVLTAVAYTFEAVITERSIMRKEIIKKAEIVTELASRLGELALISKNPEHIRKAITSLMAVSEVNFVVFYDEQSNLLGKEGEPSLLPGHHPEKEKVILERKEYFDLYTPVFTITSEEDIDIFKEVTHNPGQRKNIGWIRIGFSKAAMKDAEKALIVRGIIIAIVFLLASGVIVYKLTSRATKPLTSLSKAAKSMRKGDYPELAITSNDEIGTLTSEFNIMSRTIHEREEMLKNSLKEKELLLREIHHRVKNNMQIVSSLLNLQSDYIQEEKHLEMFNESRNRIRSMALVHEQLYKSTDLANINFNDYIDTLVNSLIAFYEKSSHNISLKIEIDDIVLGVDTAIPCGLIINELVTNSFKHAFPDSKEGEIFILAKKTGAGDEESFSLTIKDNGVGIPVDLDIETSKSLGLKLVTTLVQLQLQGRLELNRDHGTEFLIHFKELKYKKRL